MIAWVLIFYMNTNMSTTVSGIASQPECIRLAHELGMVEGGIFGQKYECHRYQAAR